MENIETITPVILSGGSGTRLWPLSRKSMPKQFVNVIDEKTLFEKTLDRLSGISKRNPIVVTNSEHRFLVAEQLRTSRYSNASVIIEPIAKNTAPAITLAAFALSELDPDSLMLICPSDHHIPGVDRFKQAILKAVPLASDDHIVTFGITPTHADTGYGYIEADPKESTSIKAFVEKPDIKRAAEYASSGNHYWNSGIFLVKARVVINEIKEHGSSIHQACLKAWTQRDTCSNFETVDEEAFSVSPCESIDYAVLEKTKAVRMIAMDCDWTDLGTWESVWRSSPKDESGNVLVGDVKQINSKDNYLRSQDKLVIVIGCDNLVVIECGDSILVAPRDATSDIKLLVEMLSSENRIEASHHPRVYRPWGDYEGVDKGDRYQVKRIVVTPGEQLSLQKHFHRAEHWIVVRGIALVTCGDTKTLIHENQSTYIPLGQTHRLENPGRIPLELIEVQSGSYLGEDDIVRIEDKYGRRRTDNQILPQSDYPSIAPSIAANS